MTTTQATARDLASLVGPDVAAAAHDAKRNVQRLLARAQSSPHQYRAERIHLVTRKVAGDYLAAMTAIREAATPEALQALQKVLLQRLGEGYQLTPNPTRDELWTRLLFEFELVTDALAENCLGRYLDRLNDLERLA